ncbi:hypothetical protein J3R30DRAFT_635127 [Lentinula aciculospora]|uniref:GST N-terminal domain-containing protein n=1 Tax=Lentinula aciculospora TaxID=153920 RepID=A0A9W9DKM6_9AGAR|nr:hypothetical protein J3R30DRAFT_635127 [Lentinula aciculospora]
MITLYDLPSSFDDPNPITYSPFVLRVKFALQHKGIPFTTHRVTYSEIASKAQAIGAPPTDVQPDGTPLYTIPFIYDSETNTAIADSFLIAKYLDRTYPNSGSTLLPEGTEILQHLFASNTVMMPFVPLYNFLRVSIYEKMDAIMQAAYVEHYQSFDIQQKFEEEEMKQMWVQTEVGLGKLDQVMGENNAFVKEEPTFADDALGANLRLIKFVIGEESKEWTAISSMWHNGRWGKYLDWLENYKPRVA